MKSLVVFCILALANADELSHLRQLASPIFDPLVSSMLYVNSLPKVKRDVVIKRLEDPDNCINKCIEDLNIRLSDPEVNETISSISASDEAKLKAICKATDPTLTCFDDCPLSRLSILLEDYWPIVGVICNLAHENYTELVTSLACINETQTRIDDRCTSKCEAARGNQSSSTFYLLSTYIIYNDNKTENTEAFQHACKYMTCLDACEDPIIKEACGAKAVSIQNKIIGTIMSAVKAMFKDVKAIEEEPEGCKRFASLRFA